MLTLRTSKHIRTMRNTKSYRSCPTGTGVSMAHLDRARTILERGRLISREARRSWLSQRRDQSLESPRQEGGE